LDIAGRRDLEVARGARTQNKKIPSRQSVSNLPHIALAEAAWNELLGLGEDFLNRVIPVWQTTVARFPVPICPGDHLDYFRIADDSPGIPESPAHLDERFVPQGLTTTLHLPCRG
jgi:hypothetical protein